MRRAISVFVSPFSCMTFSTYQARTRLTAWFVTSSVKALFLQGVIERRANMRIVVYPLEAFFDSSLAFRQAVRICAMVFLSIKSRR